MSRQNTAEKLPGVITSADMDELLAFIPSKTEMTTMLRYGVDISDVLTKLRTRAEELKAKISG